MHKKLKTKITHKHPLASKLHETDNVHRNCSAYIHTINMYMQMKLQQH